MVDELLKKVYKTTNSWNAEEIAKCYGFNIISYPIGPKTLGTRITNSRCTTIILDSGLEGIERQLVTLHEIKHCLTDKGVGTPFLRRYSSGAVVSKRESEANYFAMHALIREFEEELTGLTKYEICDFFGLSATWARFI